MEGDRPDQTESAALIPVHSLQIENGFSFENISNEHSSIAYSSLLLRYGLWKNFELRFASEFIQDKNLNKLNLGFSPFSPGIKVHIREEKGVLPQVALLAHFDLPGTGHPNFQNEHLNTSVFLSIAYSIGEKAGIGSNFGVSMNNEIPEYFYSLVFGFNPLEPLGIFIETYGYPVKGQNLDARIDAGITYKLRNNFQIDIAGGFGLTENSINNFITAGFVLRIPK